MSRRRGLKKGFPVDEFSLCRIRNTDTRVRKYMGRGRMARIQTWL